jgi:hypothetical protein
VGNEENKYSVPDPNRTMINITHELRNAHKKKSQRGNYCKIIEKHWRSYKTWLTRKYKMHSRIKTSQIKNLRRHRNNEVNSERIPTNYKVKQMRL